MPNGDRHLQHLVITGTATATDFTPKGSGPRLRIPDRDRRAHARSLLRQFRSLRTDVRSLQAERDALGLDPRAGMLLKFESAPGFDLKFESLDLRSKGIDLRSVQEIDGKTVAICYVPDGMLDEFIEKIRAYENEQTKKGQPKNRAFVESIESVQLAAIDALWTDDLATLPGEDEIVWWEVWLRGDEQDAVAPLADVAGPLGIELSDEKFVFPERTVVTVRSTKRQLSRSVRLITAIAELRAAKTGTAHYIELPPRAQRQLSEALLRRVTPPDEDNVAACLLDSGVTQAHPLLAVGLEPDDCHAVKNDWGADDPLGHGTEMAGLALYGDLKDVLNGAEPVVLGHRLESVKLIQPGDPNPPHLYGAVTAKAVGLVEARAQERKRAIGMAVTAGAVDQGEPSTWSAAVDSLTSGYGDDRRRLMLVSAGNAPEEEWHDHPGNCLRSSVQDPGQAWNALTVGACTRHIRIPVDEFPGWVVVARDGDVSPFSSTSAAWSRPWPLKPDIVLEGGNCAVDPADRRARALDDLSLLTTYRNPAARPFSTSMMTSAATALATRFAAQIHVQYPTFWPETVRALIVHSADWTEAMKHQFAPLMTREQKERLLRYCGYGVPDFERAMWSASNVLTLIAQDELQPFQHSEGRYKSKEINIHRLPWPSEALRQLGATEVKLRVTLSYFIEPNPARRGWKGRYKYASHALRFEVKTPTEDARSFERRVNLAAREEDDEQGYVGDPQHWTLGPQLRHLGSIHSDSWTGTARQLADCNMIAIYPVVGWWRERPHLNRWHRRARYSLVVTVETPRQDVDIYTPVATEIAAGVPIEIGT